MGFFDNFSRKKKYAESVVLIDIGTDSVAGAYARYAENETPVLLHTHRLPIEIRKNEAYEDAMIRALILLGNDLIREGAPILARVTGSGRSDTILVSIDAPEQEIKMRTENFERENPFLLTKSMIATALQSTSIIPRGKFLVDESIVNTIVNGYETHDPYEKEIRRASIVVLTSLIDASISEPVISVLRGLFHTEYIRLIAGRSLRCQAVHAAFSHERDALIVDSIGSLTSIALIHKNLFAALAGGFSELAEHCPLPRVLFLLARESEIASRQQELATMPIERLWLPNYPPKIISVLPSHIAGLARQTTSTLPDLQLLLMALYYHYQHHSFGRKK